jgi:hypothetical protein
VLAFVFIPGSHILRIHKQVGGAGLS